MPGLWGHEQLLNSSVVHDAVLTMINTWQTEQHHEEKSPYRWADREWCCVSLGHLVRHDAYLRLLLCLA
jgi:hypothetical protein